MSHKPYAYLVYFAIFHSSGNDTAVFVEFPFNEEDHILIKNVYWLKGCTA